LHVPIHALQVCIAVEISQAQVIPFSERESNPRLPLPRLMPTGDKRDFSP
jgi:hypothetical protein